MFVGADQSVGRPFRLDEFQIEAIQQLDAGHSVVVAAPTGAGKTLVAEHGIDLALAERNKAIYTTPIKALSNQKFHDLASRYGRETVGLLTGDSSINGEAPVVVMTTEILRNMIYGRSATLDRLGCVILDEVHYLQDPYRGPVWEEIIINADPTVRFVCLSATVSNADELADWISSVRGSTRLIVHKQRPVQLTNLYMAADRDARTSLLIPTLVAGDANPEGRQFTNETRPGRKSSRPPSKRRKRFVPPRRVEVLKRLQKQHMLPAIVFVFSRAGCSDAATQVLEAGVGLTEPEQRATIREVAERHARYLTAADRDILRFDVFLRGLEAGVAAHHAGMVPAFKEAVEECFIRGLVKLVFATETLALGINMPARAVVIERMTKFNGDSHEFLTPLEYTQLTGRAGRRGIDDHGYAIVLLSPYVTFDQVAGLAASTNFALRSAFRPTYNMAMNLIRLHDHDGAHRLLDQSFGQYQADRDLAVMDQKCRAINRAIHELSERLRVMGVDPDLDDPAVVQTRETTWRPLVEAALRRLQPGDIIWAPGSGNREPAAVLSVGNRRRGSSKVRLVTSSGHLVSLVTEDFQEPPESLGVIVMPEPYRPNHNGYQNEVGRALRQAGIAKPTSAWATPSRVAPNDSSESATDRKRLADKRRQLRKIERRISARTGRLARQFDEIVGVLEQYHYITDWKATPAGEMLRGVFHEDDLAIAEALRRGVFDGLAPAELAGLASCFTYEQRGPGPAPDPRLDSVSLREGFAQLAAIVSELRSHEAGVGVRLTREIDPGFVHTAVGWASGADLGTVLHEELTGGDFVRQIRQLTDLLRQIGIVADDPTTRRRARQAAEALHRGVVVASAGRDETDDDPVAG